MFVLAISCLFAGALLDGSGGYMAPLGFTGALYIDRGVLLRSAAVRHETEPEMTDVILTQLCVCVLI